MHDDEAGRGDDACAMRENFMQRACISVRGGDVRCTLMRWIKSGRTERGNQGMVWR